MKKFVPVLKEHKITTFLINQMVENQGAMLFESKVKQAGGVALKHGPSIIAKLSKITNSQDKDMKKLKIKTSLGIKEVQKRFKVNLSTTATGCKNRFGRIPDVEMLVEYGRGVINAYTLKEMLINWNFLKEGSKKNTWLIDGRVSPELTGRDVETKELQAFITKNVKQIKSFLKEEDLYRIEIDTVSSLYDDGFEIPNY
jgi:RecA/RadA recombinase